MVIMSLLYVLVSLFIGFLGRAKKFGFWGYFFGSLLFTPFIGVVLLFGSDTTKDKNSAR